LTSAAEQFVISLARASKRARKYLRGLAAADREDVLATAILWCWEHKTEYDPSVALDDWFIGAIRNARSAWVRGEARQSAELVQEMQGSDDPVTQAQAIEAVEAIARTLTPEENKIAELVILGHSRREIREKLGPMANEMAGTVRTKLAGLHDLMPDFRHVSRIIRSVRTPAVHDMSERTPGNIDKEIAQLEFAPPRGAECPPCWKCRWFDGFLPTGKLSTQMMIKEPEVRDAVRETEARKIAIAKGVRS
jgi:DNA-directed RNA polymerase specialized sigma24 family protein